MIHALSPYYQDSYRPRVTVSRRHRDLEAAGYTKNGDYYGKDGTKVGCSGGLR